MKNISAGTLFTSLLTTAALVASATFALAHAQSSVPKVIIESTPQQTIKGWGAFVSYHQRRLWGEQWSIVNQPDALQKALLVDSGLTAVRVNLEANYYDPSQPNQLALNDSSGAPNGLMQDLIEHLRLAKSKGINEYIMSVWSPPVIFKTNGHGGNTELKPEFEDAFVDYATNAIRYLQSRTDLPRMKGFTFQNEPGFAAPYGGTLYKFAQYNRVGQKFAAAFTAKGITGVRLIGGDAENANNLASLLIDPANKSGPPQDWVDTVSVHSYDNALWDSKQRMIDTRGVAEQAARWGREFWMTEWDMLHYGKWGQSGRLNNSVFGNEPYGAGPFSGWSVSGDSSAVSIDAALRLPHQAREKRLVIQSANPFDVNITQTAELLKHNRYQVIARVRGGPQNIAGRGSWLEVSGYDAASPGAIMRLSLSGDETPRTIETPRFVASSGNITVTLRTVGAANERLDIDDIVLFGYSEAWASDLPYADPSTQEGSGPFLPFTNDMDRALTYSRHFIRDMATFPYTHWFSWIMWHPDDSQELRTHLTGPGTNFSKARPYEFQSKVFTTVKPSQGFKVKRMRYAVPPSEADAVNLLRDREWSELDMVAFESNAKTVVLLTNRFATSRSLSVSGVTTSGSVKTFRMSDANNSMAPTASPSFSNGGFEIMLPSRTITMIEIGSDNSNPPVMGGERPASGSIITLKSASDHFISAENAGNAPLVANRSMASVWEQFAVEVNAAGEVAFRALANNRYVCADNYGSAPLIANRDAAAGAWERFDWVDRGDGSFSLRSKANEGFIQVHGNGSLIASGQMLSNAAAFRR